MKLVSVKTHQYSSFCKILLRLKIDKTYTTFEKGIPRSEVCRQYTKQINRHFKHQEFSNMNIVLCKKKIVSH